MAKLPDDKLERMEKTFQNQGDALARFESRCGWCDETIFEGDKVSQFEGEWMHQDCAEQAAE